MILHINEGTHAMLDLSGASRPARLPRRKTDVMAKGQVVIQGLCNEDIR